MPHRRGDTKANAMLILVTREGCGLCEEAKGYYEDAQEEVLCIEADESEIRTLADVARFVASALHAHTDTDEEFSWPLVIHYGDRARALAERVWSSPEAEEENCKDGVCALSGIVRNVYDFFTPDEDD